MKAEERKRRSEAAQKAEVLTEALPWINKMNGRTVVVKYGGAAMENADLMRQVVGDLMLMKLMGLRIVLVHGGGKAINALLKQLDIPVKFERGLRVTDDQTMEAVQMVLIGKVNQTLVRGLNAYGNVGVGISGADGMTFEVEQTDPALGRVGTITHVNTELIESVLDDGYIPVIASVGCGEDGFYNINADVAASEVASALGADKLVYLTDVDGLFRDVEDEESLISQLTKSEAEELLGSGTLSAGMIPKISSVVEALKGGVKEVHLLNGTFSHALLLEVFTDAGIGTMIVQDEE
ncbi:MAG: acetylglutamate kinase [Atopobiaceae bacterium]|jgi:acetylglutamate kinase|nr:acetylglutamate kinase [Atopobiaceae bacterium]MCI2050973.1 acetylglutamate kinase [Atopobiaceae bacterium]